MTYEHITYEVASHIATVTLNRPTRLNAFTVRMTQELLDAFDAVDADDDVRVLLITGTGRAFCAGADLSNDSESFGARWQVENNDEPDTSVQRDDGGLVALRIFDCLKPVIAAVNGPAIGVGATMTLPMDIRLASTEARFGWVFTRRGIVQEACSSWFLPRVVGISKAMEWVTTGSVVTAEEAHTAGLVRSVHPADELLEVAYALARDIAANTSAISIALSRQLMWKMLTADHPMRAHELESRSISFLTSSAEGREGIASFLEKRAARFEGRPSKDMPSFFPWWEPARFQP